MEDKRRDVPHPTCLVCFSCERSEKTLVLGLLIILGQDGEPLIQAVL